VLLYAIDMSEQLKSKQHEKDENGLEIGHFQRLRNMSLKIGVTAVLVVVTYAVGKGLIEGYNDKFKSLFHTTDENSVSIATLPQAKVPEITKIKTPEKPKAKVPEYIPDCYSKDEMNELVKTDIADLPPIDDTEINLELNPERTQLGIVPREMPNYADKVAGSTVMIYTNDGKYQSYGTGFVTTGDNGEVVVVTAGHVVIGEKTDKIKVIDSDGKVFDVINGCKIYGGVNDKGQYIPVKYYTKYGSNNYDVAALIVKKPGELPPPLSLSHRDLKKRDLVFATNYEIKTDGSTPKMDEMSRLYMIVGGFGLGFVDMLDGLIAENVVTDFSDRNLPGGSGGPAFNSDGDVVGVANSTEERGHYLNKTELLQQYNAVISSQVDQLIKPVYTFYSTAQVINEALVSPVLRNQSN